MEAIRKEIGAHEVDNHWTLFIRRELNGKNNIISIWSFKRKRAPDGRLIKTQGPLVRPRRYAAMGVELLGDLLPIVQLGV